MRSAPDPARADSVAGFVSCMRRLKRHAGDPSFEELRRRSGVPSSTLADALRPGRTRLPRLEVVRRFVAACGGSAGDVAAWEAAWRALVAPAPAPAPAPGGGWVTPHQLPGRPDRLAGRDEELTRLDALRHASRPSRLTLIVGAAGVGKTALALRWAHRLSREHPDGQLYVDLFGFAPNPPLAPSDALHHLLLSVGVPAGDIPEGLGARVALYRSRTYGRRILVVLDNARDPGQVRPLLPGGPGCTTVVTSRNRLSALVAVEGGARLGLAPLPPADAAQLVSMLIGADRAAAEPAAVARLVELCGALPLALRIAAANLADRPHSPVRDFVRQLAAGNRLAHLALAGDAATAVRSAFRLSYAALPAPARRLFRALADVPCPEFTVADLVRLHGRPAGEVARLVEILAAAHLVEATGPDRYAVPDLLRLYAASLGRPAARRAA